MKSGFCKGFRFFIKCYCLINEKLLFLRGLKPGVKAVNKFLSSSVG
jgi:hypothetical protein